MKKVIDNADVRVRDLAALNRLQSGVVGWAVAHAKDDFFQPFFQSLQEELERYHRQLSLYPACHEVYHPYGNLHDQWQANLLTAETRGMKSKDFFVFVDKLFSLEAKTLQSLLKGGRLNEKIEGVLSCHLREITLLREAMAFLEQYDCIFSSTKVAMMTPKVYQAA